MLKDNVTVVIATHGTQEWNDIGINCILELPSGFNILRIHKTDMDLSEVRNYAISKVDTEYVCFLDADDTLPKDYFNFIPTTDITVTKIKYGDVNLPMLPKVWQHENFIQKSHRGDCKASCLVDGNWIHIGAVMKTDIAKRVKFRDYPCYEDWAYWLEQHLLGSTFSTTNKVYHASVRKTPGHRNKAMPLRERNKVHEQIIKDLIG